MKNSTKNRRPAQRREARKLARLNTKITRLSSELETLHFMHDRLEREIESAERSNTRSNSKNAPAGGNNQADKGGIGQ